MKVQEIRERFSKFFENKGHVKLPSSPLVPINDDTLLFANAGMNQFKDFFTGKAKPKDKRAVTIQKVVRAGGKHNDLENVGLTARHHTFFEMLGNFSFGDYFKEDAIKYAWEFLTSELSIPADKLYVTVHHTDDEAFEIWEKTIGIPKEKIFKKGDKDNFWEMGDIGPCGPCSEIFYDHGEKYSTPNFKPQKGQDLLDDEMRYVEVWNLVFMQFEKDGTGDPKPLPNPSIDTGMGLERIAAVLQGKYWNYDTDAFTPIISQIELLTEKLYNDQKFTSSMRIVADHIRSSTMLITDGVIPSNEGRGYVLRRIIRRAVRHLKNLEAPKGTFSKLSKVVLKELGSEYPQNKANASLAEKLLLLEEEKFLETLDTGLKYLEDAINNDVVDKTLSGKSAFKLYDTYGFPLDLTQIILEEKGLQLDEEEFHQCMQERREDSKKSWKGALSLDDKVFHQAKEDVGSTTFLGYKELESQANLLKLIDLDDKIALIFDRTPFYGEGGGQVGDKGWILDDSENVIAEVIDTQKPVDDLWIHIVKGSASNFKIKSKYLLRVDKEKRALTARNHSATHLLQSALINVLGSHVKQSGSLVDSERLRFDFTHMKAMSESEIQEVEDMVNGQVQLSNNVDSNIMGMDDALKAGALALFGEKYTDEVRVLKMGEFSTELCGGTHVSNTSEIGLFSIISESSLSTGVRRIEATTSLNAIRRLNQRSQTLKSVEKLLSTKGEKVIEKVKSLGLEVKALQKEIGNLSDKLVANSTGDLFKDPESLKNGTPFKFAKAPNDSDLRKLSDLFLDKVPSGILLLIGESKGKLSILLRTAKKSKIPCNEVLKETLPLLNGRGGGRPDMAQGSGEMGDIDHFVAKTKQIIESKL